MKRLLRHWIESGAASDRVARLAVQFLLAQRRRELAAAAATDPARYRREFAAALAAQPLAKATEIANRQHYEVPTEFFQLMLGPRLKYSAGLWPTSDTRLEAAEDAMLAATAERAQLADGQSILDLGCGWGSFSLWAAARFPHARITAVSNSRTQRAFIEDRCRERGLTPVRVLTADMNHFSPEETYDRIVSVEMFEHLRNWPHMMARVRNWLRPDGRLFVHVFCHRTTPYFFEGADEDDWMARFFFTGGMMPAADLLPLCAPEFILEQQWEVNGCHYGRTLRAWLERLDAQRAAAWPILAATYGANAADLWLQRWRLFLMACEELFNCRHGMEWYVAHYRFARSEENRS